MFTFMIKDDDGHELKFVSDSRDIAMWERTTKGATMGQLASNDGADMSFVALYKIAWFAARRQLLIPSDMTLPDFERKYAIELEDDDDKKAEADEEDSIDDPEASFAEVAA